MYEWVNEIVPTSHHEYEIGFIILKKKHSFKGKFILAFYAFSVRTLFPPIISIGTKLPLQSYMIDTWHT